MARVMWVEGKRGVGMGRVGGGWRVSFPSWRGRVRLLRLRLLRRRIHRHFKSRSLHRHREYAVMFRIDELYLCVNSVRQKRVHCCIVFLHCHPHQQSAGIRPSTSLHFAGRRRGRHPWLLSASSGWVYDWFPSLTIAYRAQSFELLRVSHIRYSACH